MSSLDLATLGVSAVDVATIEQDVINQVKQSKKNTLNKELQSIESNIEELKNEIKRIGRILQKCKEKKINLSPKEIKFHLKKQKQSAKELESKIENKTEIINKIKFIDNSIITSPKRGKKRKHHEIDNNNNNNNDDNNNNNNSNHQWQCTRCTLLNDIENIQCSICNTIKPRNLNINDINSRLSMRPPPNKKQKVIKQDKSTSITVSYKPYTHDCDDGDDHIFESRLQSFYELKSALDKLRRSEIDISDINIDTNVPYTFYDDSLGFIDCINGTKYSSISRISNISNCVPLWLYNSLYKFQRRGLEWFYNLYKQDVGGILGDDMGLGKTIQTLSFLESLRVSQCGGPALIICPASVLTQWMRECHKWSPEIRCILLHDTGRHKVTNREIINKIILYKYCGIILITTYTSLKLNDSLLLPIKWGIVILDEGHKIKNPNSQITLTCKQLKTRHRMILTGSPLQNTLSDLWSLFDFIFPGRLATLPVFEEEFVNPIKLGGYTHATNIEIEASIACANCLKDIIDPYILRRTKENVKNNKNLNFIIPNKTEKVLFCKLSEKQLEEYKGILNSNEMKKIFEFKAKGGINYNWYYDKYDRDEQQKRNKTQIKGFTFRVITMLKKICNHSDLLMLKGNNNNDLPIDYGTISRSGKLKVLKVILSKWKEEGHKALIFCQTKQFLNIVEKFVINSGSYIYNRLDGSTPVRNRQNIISEFNNNCCIFLLLLTTKAGGLGINLTGADRVIIMDPDWNPSTDQQARERAYRIGQNKDVIIYRFIVKGTIEEKVYQRQIYKQFLTDKVLKDPNHQRVFSEKDLKDLFSLDLDNNNNNNDIVVADNNHNDNDIFNDLNATITSKHINNNNDDDGNMLSLLFSSNGIASALRHDRIEDIDENERIEIEKRAKKFAKRALKTLEKSRKEINNHSITKPTWTGIEGFNFNAIHEKRKKFGNHRDLIHIIRSKLNNTENTENNRNIIQSQNGRLSSASLLNQIKARKTMIDNNNNNNNDNKDKNERKKISDLKEKRYELLVNDLYNFVKEGGDRGGIKSGDLIQNFDHRLLSEEEQFMFKIILQKMCKLIANNSNSRKIKCWVLKEKYKSL